MFKSPRLPAVFGVSTHRIYGDVADIRIHHRDGVLTPALVHRIAHHMEIAAHRSDICCVVLRAARRTDFGRSAAHETAASTAVAMRRIDRLATPCIAVVEGRCEGTGLLMALACDIVLATPNAHFEARLDSLEAAGTAALAARVGRTAAMQMLLLGTPMSAEHAVASGLVDEIADSDRLDDAIARRSRSVRELVGETRRLISDT